MPSWLADEQPLPLDTSECFVPNDVIDGREIRRAREIWAEKRGQEAAGTRRLIGSTGAPWTFVLARFAEGMERQMAVVLIEEREEPLVVGGGRWKSSIS